MSPTPIPPADLRRRIVGDLAPVRPLAAPWRRAAWLGLLGLASIAFAWFRLRAAGSPAAPLGAAISCAEWVAGLTLVWLALREAVPALGLGRGLALAALAGGLAVELGAAALLATSRGELWAGDGGAAAGLACARGEGSFALPVAAIVFWLLLRAFPLRARWASALAGGAAGLFADAAWHLVCTRSDLVHLLVWHFGALLVLALAGYSAGLWVERRSARA